MIFEGSRYQGGVVEVQKDVHGTYQLGVYRVDPGLVPTQQSFHIDSNTRLESIAQQLYNDPTLWWYIADANPDLAWFDDIPAGTVIRIPSGPLVR